ncbi:hypothetical protein ACQPZJ_26220 [Actinoplanes sp. CA-054009]
MATATEKPADRTRPATARQPGYDQFLQVLEEGDADDVADALLHLDEQRRRALVPRIRATDPRRRRPPAGQPETSRRRPNPDSDDRVRREGALLVAGAGCLPTSDEVVAWLRSPRFKGDFPGRTIAAVLRVLQSPGRPGLATVATDLAAALKHREHDRGEWDLTAAALHAAGLPLPRTEPVLRGWVRQFSAATSPGALAARLAEDPWLETQLPTLLATPKVATDLGDIWPAALALLAAGKRIDRRELIALLIARLRSGDRGAALRPALETFRHLDPTAEERAAHRADFLAMLSEPNGPVAELAQRVLRSLDDAGHLDADTVAAAMRAALARTEKKLIRAQVAWLDRAIGRHPSAAPALLEAAASIVDSDDPEVAERALRIVGSHSAGPDALRPATDALTGDLRRQADEIIGQPSIPPGPRFPPSPRVYVPEPMPPAIGSLPELSATLAHAPLTPVDLERALAAIAKFAMSARPDLAWALAPHAADKTSPLADLIQSLVPPELAAAASAAARPTGSPARKYAPLGARRSPGTAPAPSTFLTPAVAPTTSRPNPPAVAADTSGQNPPAANANPTSGRNPSLPGTSAAADQAIAFASAHPGVSHRQAAPGHRPLPAPQEMLRLRIRELADQLSRGEGPPALLATPATQDGHVDPARLLLRLASAERAGWQPGPYDLAQALLRLPRETPSTVLTAATRLNSTAGRRFAAWLRTGGLPDPAITVVAPPTGPAERSVAFAPLEASGLALPSGLLAMPADQAHTTYPDLSCWPMVLPSHREIIAAHLLHARPEGSNPDHPAEHSTETPTEQPSGHPTRPAAEHFIRRPASATAEHPIGHTKAAIESPTGHDQEAAVDAEPGVLSALARSSGPFGPAMAIALAQALTAGTGSGRRDAVAAVGHLARCGGLDAGLLGRELALLLAARPDDLHPTTDALADLARGGSQHAVWAILHAVVPALLRLERSPAGLPDLLALATAVAAAINARAHLPEVAAAAARPDRTRLKNEAARLARTLA